MSWAKHSRFDETRRARWSRVMFEQARTVVSGTCNHEVAFRHLLEVLFALSDFFELKGIHNNTE